jgi:hypothetical protein
VIELADDIDRSVAVTEASLIKTETPYSKRGKLQRGRRRSNQIDITGQSTIGDLKDKEDPIGLFPSRVILGINKRGVHFFRPVPKEYLHRAELCDIMQFGSSTSAVFFHMRIAGAFRVFQFETKQGEDMCVALQTHINDVMIKHLARARFISNDPLKNTGLSSNVKPPSVEVYEKRLHEMSKLLESSQKRIDELVKDMQVKDKREREIQEQPEGLRDKWLSEQKNLSDIAKDRENLWKLLEEKESELQNLLASARRGTLTSDTKQKSMPQKHERSLQVKNLEAQADMLRKELRLKSDELALTEENYKEVAIEKQLLEQKVILLEKNKNDETRSLYTMFEQERETLRNRAADLEKKLTEQTQELNVAQSNIALRTSEIEAMHGSVKELEELRELKEDVDRKNEQTAAILNGSLT